jgi:transposase
VKRDGLSDQIVEVAGPTFISKATPLDRGDSKPGKPRVDDRRVISGILHVLKTGCRWRDVPPEYGPATTIYNCTTDGRSAGFGKRLFEQIAASGDIPHELSLDSSHVKAHRSAAGAKGGSGRKRLVARAGDAPRKSIV